ncbi:MAG: NeuD/PglB/VioB family sugar acetyltransferase [Anaerolineales bacterium]|nr:NeuD/PglB/VioB family sugar acetyltransferase [Anaerolineales bacterium]
MKEQITPIYFPLINPNEAEMMLVSIAVQQGQVVEMGQVLATVETTKATSEIIAENRGYIFLVHQQAGVMVRAGDLFGYLSPNPQFEVQNIQREQPNAAQTSTEAAEIGNLRITAPAQRLAKQMGIDLSRLPKDEWITEQRLRRWIEEEGLSTRPSVSAEIDSSGLLIFGGGGHGKSLIELIRASGQHLIAGVIDDNKPLGSLILGVPIIGRSQDLPALYQRGYRLMVNAVGGIGDISQRIAVFEHGRSAGFAFPTVIHPTAFIEESAILGEGAQVFPHAYVGSDAYIGFGAIINTGAIVSHDCQLGDYVNLSPGSILAGEVVIGEATLIGMGVTVNLRVKIGARCRIGNGAIVKQDVPDHTIVRAGGIWPS